MNLPDNCKTVQSTTYRCIVEVRVSEFDRGRGIERIVSQHDGSGDCRAWWIVDAHSEPEAIKQYSAPFRYFAELAGAVKAYTAPLTPAGQ